MRDEDIRQKFDEYFSKGAITNPRLEPTAEELLSYLIEHEPLNVTHEMMADYFSHEEVFKRALARWGLTCERDPFTCNYTVRRPERAHG